MNAEANHFETVNPATGEKLNTYQFHSKLEADRIIALSTSAFQTWRTKSITSRAQKFLALEKALLTKKEALALLMTNEMGKLLSESTAEVEKCAKLARHYAEKGPGFLAIENAETTDVEGYVEFDPLGPILAVMPWNFPLWQVMRFSVPTLLAGNTVLLKHAPNVQGSALALEEVFLAAGFAPGVFQNLILEVADIKAVVEDSRIKGVTLTGSPKAGESLAAQAGAVLKKCVLELGGSDAFIVLEDADLEKAAEAAVKSRFQNAGQVCIAAKRFIVVNAVAEKFEALFLKHLKKLKTGKPTDPDTTLAPLARKDLRDGLEKQVQDSVRLGARILAGGKSIEGQGFYFEPTLLTDAKPNMPIYSEEIFGPVATLFRVNDAKAAIELANSSQYGLSSAIWTKNLTHAKELARDIDAGGVFINSISQSDPRIPIGGVKRSGFGRELSHFGIREFTNIKSVWIDHS